MKFGTSISPIGNLVENIKQAPEEFDFIEIPIGELERKIEEIPVDEASEVAESNGYGVIVHLPFGQPVVTQVEKFDRVELEYLEKVIETGESLGAEKAVLHPNIRYREEPDDVEERFRRQLEELDRICREAGIELCVENMPPQINTAANNFELAEVLEDKQISMCFDTGHGFASLGQEEMEEFLEKHSGVVSHLHLQDTREGEDMHLPVGSAEIDFEPLGKIMKDFDGTATLEVFTEDNDYKLLSLEKAKEYF